MRRFNLVKAVAVMGLSLGVSPPALAGAASPPASSPNRVVETDEADPICVWGPAGGQNVWLAHASTSGNADCDGAWVQLHYTASGGVHRTHSMHRYARSPIARVEDPGVYRYSCHAIYADGEWSSVVKRGTGSGACGSPR